MPDPNIASGVVIGATMAAPSLLIPGIHGDALALGLISAVFVTFWMQAIDSKAKAASAVLFSSMIAGWGSSPAAAIVAEHMPALASGDGSLRILLAILLGAATPTLFPALLHMLERKGNSL